MINVRAMNGNINADIIDPIKIYGILFPYFDYKSWSKFCQNIPASNFQLYEKVQLPSFQLPSEFYNMGKLRESNFMKSNI